jgi:hypothetical protein
MPHALTGSFQQASGVPKNCAVEEADVNMTFERVDVREWPIFYACDWTAIVHQLSDIVTALPNLDKPLPRNRPQVHRLIGQPGGDCRVLFYRPGQPEDVAHADQPAEIQRNAARPMLAHNFRERRTEMREASWRTSALWIGQAAASWVGHATECAGHITTFFLVGNGSERGDCQLVRQAVLGGLAGG